MLVEPGVTRTSFEENITRPDRPLAVYDAVRADAEKLMREIVAKGDAPEVVAAAVIRAANAASPKRRYTAGKAAGQVRFMRRFLPEVFRRQEPSEIQQASRLSFHCRTAGVRLTTETKVSPMKSFLIDRYAKGGALRLGEMPEPELRENDVLVEIHAAGVNLLDNKIRDGEFKLILPYRLPLVLGNDVAGVVVRVGANVRQFKPGDEVYARPAQDRIGTFAEFIAMDEADVALKPNNLTMEEAASIPLVALTAWQVLVERAKLRRDRRS